MRHAGAGPDTNGVGVDWHVAPSQWLGIVFTGAVFERCFAEFAEFFVLREEAHRDRVVGRFWQLYTGLGGDLVHELVGHLHEDACAVAGFRVTTASAAMPEVAENFQTVLDDVVGPLTVDIGYDTDAACVVLVAFEIEPLLFQSSKFGVAFGSASPHFTGCVFQRHRPCISGSSNLNLNIVPAKSFVGRRDC